MLRARTFLLVPVFALVLAACGSGGGDAPAALAATGGGSPDTTPPTTPTLNAPAAASTAIDLSWQASSDNVGVTGYEVERCQGPGCSTFAQVATPTGTSFTDTGLAPATSYSYRVRAADAVANLSAYSNVANTTTTSAGNDTTPPTAPTALTATPADAFRVNLSWQLSSDDVGVTGYGVERCQGAGCTTFSQFATTTVTSFTATSLAPATSYSFRVRATDAAANVSAYSNVASATTANAPALPAWVNALTIGQWHEIPNTAMSGVAPSPTPAGMTGPASKVIAWTSFVVDTRTSKVYSVAGGGHNDYAGNEVDVLDLDRDQPVWSELLAPSPSGQVTDCQNYYLDSRPTSRHTYYGSTFNEFDNRIMLFTGAGYCSNGGPASAISSYNIGSNTYSPPTTHGNVTTQCVAPNSTFTANPLTGDVFALCGNAFAKWTRSTNVFANMSPSGTYTANGYKAMSAFDTTRERAFFLGGSGDVHQIYTPGTNTFAQITLNGANQADVATLDTGAMTYIPAIDRYLVRNAASGGTVYQVNPSTFEVTTLPTTGGGSVPATINGPYNKFLYVPNLRGAVYVPSYAGNAWFLRLH
ncbi:MAG: fibronectin type III domain-containing protein [Gammaproteobacteria bacterium]|nr:fibronectin type III domain-containing protein [Gammaproteobacteria bacterium]